MEVRKLYYEDAYIKEFHARVLSCEEKEGVYLVTLDQTAFYPEGGGQPCDLGVLGDVRVFDVQESAGQIVHYVEAPLETGTEVQGIIDWNRRFDLMQQHSGEHIVSGLAHRKYQYDNVGFHMGDEVITVDLSGPLTWEQLMNLEKEANAYLWTDTAVKSCMIDGEDPDIPYRSKKLLEGEIRLVEFPGADLCACCGTHVMRTGEIGLIKIISAKKFHDGVRFEMLCGQRALEYLSKQMEENQKVSVSLSVPSLEISQAAEHLKQEIYDLKGQIMAIRELQYDDIASRCDNAGDILVIRKDLSSSELRKCSDRILDVCGGICAVVSGSDDTGYKYAIGQRNGDVRDLVREANMELGGRGGGKPFFAQGSLSGPKHKIEAFFAGKGFVFR